MSHPKQAITLNLSIDLITRLQHLASEQHTQVDDIVADLLGPILHVKKHDILRIVQPDRKGSPVSDSDGLREIIKRQDDEIAWLRDQITRLSSLTPTTHIIKHEYPALTVDRPEPVITTPGIERKDSRPLTELSASPEPILPAHVSLDDVLYTPAESGIDSDDIMKEGFSEPARIGDQALRDFIGGIREEKKYSVAEAAAIAGETETVLLEYIADGFLPAEREGSIYRIRGLDLRRYMMSK